MAGRGVLFEVADAVALQQDVDWERCAERAAPAQRQALGHLRTVVGDPRTPRVRSAAATAGAAGRDGPGFRLRAPRARRARRRRPSPVGGRVGDGAQPAALGHREHAGRVHRAGGVPGLEPGLPAGVRDDPGRRLLPHGPPHSLPGVRAGAVHRRPVRPPGPAAGRGLRPPGGVLGAAGGRGVGRRSSIPSCSCPRCSGCSFGSFRECAGTRGSTTRRRVWRWSRGRSRGCCSWPTCPRCRR